MVIYGGFNVFLFLFFHPRPKIKAMRFVFRSFFQAGYEKGTQGKMPGVPVNIPQTA
jgi:hypothetical protein